MLAIWSRWVRSFHLLLNNFNCLNKFDLSHIESDQSLHSIPLLCFSTPFARSKHIGHTPIASQIQVFQLVNIESPLLTHSWIRTLVVRSMALGPLCWFEFRITRTSPAPWCGHVLARPCFACPWVTSRSSFDLAWLLKCWPFSILSDLMYSPNAGC